MATNFKSVRIRIPSERKRRVDSDSNAKNNLEDGETGAVQFENNTAQEFRRAWLDDEQHRF